MYSITRWILEAFRSNSKRRKRQTALVDSSPQKCQGKQFVAVFLIENISSYAKVIFRNKPAKLDVFDSFVFTVKENYET